MQQDIQKLLDFANMAYAEAFAKVTDPSVKKALIDGATILSKVEKTLAATPVVVGFTREEATATIKYLEKALKSF